MFPIEHQLDFQNRNLQFKDEIWLVVLENAGTFLAKGPMGETY